MRSRSLILPLVLGFAASFVACDDDEGDVGSPCSESSDCADGLICDEHDGQSSCQNAHGHESGEESGEHESEHGTGHDSGTGG